MGPHLTPDHDAQTIIKIAQSQFNRPPAPLPRIHTEGTHPKQGIYNESLKASKDFLVTLEAAMAWAITREPVYIDFTKKAVGWLVTYAKGEIALDSA